jgi:hypothetical protein
MDEDGLGQLEKIGKCMLNTMSRALKLVEPLEALQLTMGGFFSTYIYNHTSYAKRHAAALPS